MGSIEELIKQELGTSVFRSTGQGGGGCISNGTAYETDSGIVFAKFNDKSEALRMFEGEFESLAALKSTDTVKVPSPIKVISNPRGGAVLVMEYVDIRGLSRHARKLGEQMARLHLHNSELGKTARQKEQSVHKGNYSCYTDKFGFPTTTCCGYLPQENKWSDTWPYNDRKVGTLWSTLVPSLPKLFKDVVVEPSLVHGDLWGGNAGETGDGPVVFDPASFYGHSEYDLAISNMFGGFGRDFFTS
ncbi:ketosamine-3-kinase, partial [Aplysia californica]|uniref:protein-ribulosamine 3-kinase n=1 Tax=Aplysia californica TaxID=6500 RepID=A0ABM1VZ97_APLCA